MEPSHRSEVTAVPFREINLPVGECIRRGWNLAIENLGPLIGFTCIYMAIVIALAFLPIVGWIVSWVISPALSAGYFIYIRKRIRGEAASFDDFFGGFQFLLPLFLVGLVSGVLIFLGILLCIIPGLYLAIGYMFSSYLVVARNMDFWRAMETSRRAVTANLGSMIVLVLAIVGINILGILALLLGLVVTIPATYCATVVAFHVLFESEPPPIPPAAAPIRI